MSDVIDLRCIRVEFTKRGKVRFTSHRDVARMFERALRRAKLPVAYTEGFSPRPKLHFGLALPTGYESEAEYLDIDVLADGAESIDLATLPALLTAGLPVGIEVTRVGEVPARGATSLQQAVTCTTWRIVVDDDLTAEAVETALTRALEAPEITVTRQRKGKDVTDDIRPYIRSLHLVANSATGSQAEGLVIEAELGTQPRGLRPAELLAAFEPPMRPRQVCRLHQTIETDDTRFEPLSREVSSQAQSELCAS